MSHQVHTLLKVTLQQFSTILAFLLARNLRLERKKKPHPSQTCFASLRYAPEKVMVPSHTKTAGIRWDVFVR
jgi:hypothetical protein